MAAAAAAVAAAGEGIGGGGGGGGGGVAGRGGGSVIVRTASALRSAASTLIRTDGGAAAASRATGGAVTPFFLRYWAKKRADPLFKSGSHGGARHYRFDPETRVLLDLALWALLMENPTTCCDALAAAMSADSGEDITKPWVSRRLRAWGWSWKVAGHKQILKYTATNIEYTAMYLNEVRTLPWWKLKFADEVHFEGRGLRRKMGVAPKGDPVAVVSACSIAESYSVTAVTNPMNPAEPVVASIPRVGTNTAEDFANFVEDLINARVLTAGDVFIVDNASVHVAADTAVRLHEMLDRAQVRLLTLPTYSPEFNPIELVFAQVKRHIRTHRAHDQQLWHAVAAAFAHVTAADILNYYSHCLNI